MPTPTSFVLTPEIAQAAGELAKLLAATYAVPGDGGGRKALADNELAARLCTTVSPEFALADWAVARLGAEETLSAYQYGMLDLAERTVAELLSTPAFHTKLTAPVAAYRGLFAAAALPADGWLINPRHPARDVLIAIHDFACGWEPAGGTARADIENLLDALLHWPPPWQDALADWQAKRAAEQSRVERLGKRLLDAEAGALRTRRARQLAARTLNQSLAGRETGAEVAAVLVQDWLPAMQWVLLTEGEQGPLWQRTKRLTGLLRWTLSPEIGSEERNRLIRLTAQVTDEMAGLLPLVIHDEAARARLQEAIDGEHTRILRQEAGTLAAFAPVDAHDAFADAATTLSDTLLAEVKTLQPGQWMILRDAVGEKRVRLLLKQDDAQQLLFMNAQGAKALGISWEAFALQLTKGEAEALPLRAPLERLVAAALRDLAQRHELSRQSRLETLRLAREQAAAEARVREEARQKALAEAQALEQARLEAQRHATRAEDGARSAEQQRARLLASSLTVGTWLAFRDEAGNVERRKLAVLLPSSGKYVFVDVDGTGKRELLRDELIKGIAAGRIAALGKDQRLEDALTRVVDNLRNERGGSE